MRSIDDASEAIEMLLDEDACRVYMGNSFMFISNDDTEQYLKVESKRVKQDIRNIKVKLNETIEEMTKLRAKLKSKFGDHIGLPEISANKKVKR